MHGTRWRICIFTECQGCRSRYEELGTALSMTHNSLLLFACIASFIYPCWESSADQAEQLTGTLLIIHCHDPSIRSKVLGYRLLDWYYVSLCCEQNSISVVTESLWEVSQYVARQTIISPLGPRRTRGWGWRQLSTLITMSVWKFDGLTKVSCRVCADIQIYISITFSRVAALIRSIYYIRIILFILNQTSIEM